MNKTIIETLKAANNEGTCSPYWLIIDPSAIEGRLRFNSEEDPEGSYSADLDDEFVVEGILAMIPHCITGPYFSRKDAEDHLKARHYEFSKKSYVYCHSGYWSRKYKDFCREIQPAKPTHEGEK